MKSKEKVRLEAYDVRFIRTAAGYRLFQEVICDTGEVTTGVGTVHTEKYGWQWKSGQQRMGDNEVSVQYNTELWKE
jgi:hypothetical protein